MGYFPFFTNVSKLRGVIIGGGNIALEKVIRLLPFDPLLTVVASKICDELKQYEGRIVLINDEYKSDYLDDADFVIAATDNMGLNEKIYSDAKERRLLINVVDVPDKCDFIFPSVLKRGKLSIGVSTSGAGPQVAIRLKNDIEKIIPDNIEEILDILAKERLIAKERIPDPALRRKYLIDLANRLLNDDEQ